MALRLHHRLLQQGYLAYSRLARGMTLGVRAMLLKDDSVVLVKHTYLPGWYFPGGGVERGETLGEALERESREEAGVVLGGSAELFGVYRNGRVDRRDHVALYVCRDWQRLDAPNIPNREIAACETFPLDRLPDDASPATRRRIREVLGGAPLAPIGNSALPRRNSGSTQAVAVVRGIDDHERTERHDARRVDAHMAVIIVLLGVLQVDRVLHARHLEEVAHIGPEIGVVGDPPTVALEVADIDGVEADERGEEPPVGLRQAVAHQEALLVELAVELVERVEERAERLFVGLLRLGEAGAIDAVVDGRVDDIVDGVDVAAQLFGIEVERYRRRMRRRRC